ncbi:fatty acid synthase alpha subunit Lsd1, partial [Coemansia nantahalensis]
GISAERTYRLSGDAALLPGGGSEAWAAVLSGGRKCWLHAALTARVIVRGQQHVENFLPRVLRPRAGRTFSVAVDEASSAPTAVTVFSADGAKELELELAADGARLALRIHHTNGHLHRAVCLEFVYSPQTPLAPIHEDVDASSDNIRRFFADIWLLTGDDAPTVERLPGDELAFTARGIPVVSDQVAAFCRSVGIDLAAYPPNSDQATAVPTDYLFVLVLPAIFRALTEPPVFSSLLHMVQTSLNAEHAPGATPLAVGDTVDVVVRVLEISNGVAGKKVALEAVLHCTSRGDGQDAKLVATLHSEFVFLGAEVGPGEAFRRTTEPSMVATFATPTDVAVLESKEWFRYLADAPARVQPGTRLEFALKSEYRLAASGDGYAAVRTTGAVYRRSIYQRREHIADVDYSEGASIGNPVLAYLQARAEPAQTTQALPDGGYELKPHGLVTVAPASALEYAAASGDHNPHNTNAYVADIAGLPAPLMHGLWSSAATRRLVEKHVAAGDPTRVRRFRARLLGMVFPGDELRTRLFHTAMRNGALVVRGHTSRAETGEVVLECEAEVAQPRTAYVFTGQGSQEPGMLTALCERSPVARQMCDRIDAHVRDRFGFSLLEIVRDNPKECTVHFGGTEGARIRRNYAQFMRHVDAPDGGFKQVPLFDIAPTARCLTFNSPTGLLNSTQFAQPAIMLFDLASVAEMRDRGVYVEDAITAGHSLGEYGAVSSIGFTTPEDIVDVTFIRGATMQATVERDADFNSDFAMVAVNPTRVHRDFGEDGLAHVIDELRERGGGKLLEIVNYNVQQFQYVVAGTRAQLALLGAVLDAIHARQLN